MLERGKREKEKRYFSFSIHKSFLWLLRTEPGYCVEELNENSEIFEKQPESIRSFKICFAWDGRMRSQKINE